MEGGGSICALGIGCCNCAGACQNEIDVKVSLSESFGSYRVCELNLHVLVQCSTVTELPCLPRNPSPVSEVAAAHCSSERAHGSCRGSRKVSRRILEDLELWFGADMDF